MKSINELVIDSAKIWLNQKEVPGNMGFEDPLFQRYLQLMGWDYGQAWCTYFGELVWKWAYSQYNSLIVDEIDKLFSAGAVKTWKNFLASDFVCNQTFESGCLAIWQTYKAGMPYWTGHLAVGIEEFFTSKLFATIEGNTNARGSREGDRVLDKTKPMDFNEKINGHVLLGFVHPKH